MNQQKRNGEPRITDEQPDALLGGQGLVLANRQNPDRGIYRTGLA